MNKSGISNVVAALLLLVLVFSMAISVYFLALSTVERMEFQSERERVLQLMTSIFYERSSFGRKYLELKLGAISSRTFHVSISVEAYSARLSLIHI